VSEPNKKALALILATALAVPAEGLRQYAYRDVTGLPTICFGSTTGVRMGDFRTIPECKALLTKEMIRVISAVDSCRPGLPINVLAAFADAAYNIGPKIACDSSRSTAARYLASGNYAAACRELPKWNKASVAGFLVALPGLTTRRLMERDVCLAPQV
jgi:GH24 family phage-related lysozyme (muramidase)